MSVYLLYFFAMLLLGITYVYNHFVLAPKLKALHNAIEFRQARNLNTELIDLLNTYGNYLQNSLFDGDTYETTMSNLQVLRSNVYTADTFEQLVGKQKIKHRHIDALRASISQQLQMQQHLKTNLSKVVNQYKQLKAA